MKVIIFANGAVPQATQIPLQPEAWVIAADGGARHCLKLGIMPQVVIGDFDSLTAAETNQLEAAGTRLIRHPADKDETDLELALDCALQQGASQVTCYGMLGGRWDMSFANLLLLAAPRYAHLRCRVVAGDTEAHILHAGQTLELRGQPGDTVSVVPLHGAARGLTYHGLQWPLQNATLPFGSPRGVSNRMTDSTAQITLKEGVVVVWRFAG